MAHVRGSDASLGERALLDEAFTAARLEDADTSIESARVA